GSGSELARRRFHPSLRIEHELLVRVDAFAVRILQEQRLTRYPIHAGALEYERVEVALRRRRRNQSAARVPKDAAHQPIAGDRAYETVARELRSLIVQSDYEDQRLRA